MYTSYSDGVHTRGYRYDASGNRTQLIVDGVVQANSIDPASNRLRSVTIGKYVAPIQTDAIGNQKSNGTGPVFTYGPTGRIESVIDINTYTGVNYYYNSIGERLNTGNSYYLHDQGGRLVGEYDLNGDAIEETVYLGEQPIVVLKPTPAPVTNPIPDDTGVDDGLSITASPTKALAGTPGTDVYYVYADHLNTPRWITRAIDNQVVWRWQAAEPFGASLPDNNPTGLGTFVYNRRFPGQVYDATLEVNYNYFRDYDPGTGRYLQSDPIGLNGGINTYGYVRNNPVNLVDPLGLVDIYVGGAKDGTTKIVRSWVDKNATGSPYFEWTQGSELSEFISTVPAKEPINLFGHSYGGDTAAWAAMRAAGRVSSLTTLDPVSRFRPDFKKLRCSVGAWRNVNAVPFKSDRTDTIAWLGGKWGNGPRAIATSFAEANVNHGDFGGLMRHIDTISSDACECPAK